MEPRWKTWAPGSSLHELRDVCIHINTYAHAYNMCTHHHHHKRKKRNWEGRRKKGKDTSVPGRELLYWVNWWRKSNLMGWGVWTEQNGGKWAEHQPASVSLCFLTADAMRHVPHAPVAKPSLPRRAAAFTCELKLTFRCTLVVLQQQENQVTHQVTNERWLVFSIALRLRVSLKNSTHNQWAVGKF